MFKPAGIILKHNVLGKFMEIWKQFNKYQHMACLFQQPGPDWNSFKTVKWITVKFGTDIHDI